MKRGTNKNNIINLLQLMRNAKDSFVRTGFIIGHPYEEENDFDELCNFINDFNFDRISIFGYSKEENTNSYFMPQIPNKIINNRLKIIEKIVNNKLKSSFISETNKIRQVVCTGISSEGEFFAGAKDLRWDRDIDGEILINESLCGILKQNQIYECKITDTFDNKLIATALKNI